MEKAQFQFCHAKSSSGEKKPLKTKVYIMIAKTWVTGKLNVSFDLNMCPLVATAGN